jgi:hypothetical protein
MRRPQYLLAVTVVVGLVMAACASPAGSGEPGASSGSEPSAAPAASQGGGGGDGGEVTLADGGWTGGHASASISGDTTATIEADLFPSTSITDGGNTFFQYLSADGRQIAVAIYPDPYSVAVSVVTAEISGGGSTDGGQCEASFSRTDDNALEGEIHCVEAPGITATGVTQAAIDIELTFTATR